jgi:hypothetical protein
MNVYMSLDLVNSAVHTCGSLVGNHDVCRKLIIVNVYVVCVCSFVKIACLSFSPFYCLLK